MDDPDPANEGRAGHLLVEAGIEVESGILEGEALEILEPYTHQRQTGRPFVTAKFASSLDGKIAAASSNSRWISSPESRELAHQMRTQVDAILVGSETIVVDNPRLTARPGGELPDQHQPLRVVLDARGRVSPEAAVFGEPGDVLVLMSDRSSQAWRDSIATVADVDLVASAHSGQGVQSSWRAGCSQRARRPPSSPRRRRKVHGSFFDAGLVEQGARGHRADNPGRERTFSGRGRLRRRAHL